MSPHHLLIVVVVSLLGADACGGGDAPRHRPEKPSQGSSPAASRPVRTWTHATVLRRINGRRIVVAGKRVPIDPATVTCSGLGQPVLRDGRREWARFRCVQPTFPPGRVAGPDAIFVVQAGQGRFRVADARFARY